MKDNDNVTLRQVMAAILFVPPWFNALYKVGQDQLTKVGHPNILIWNKGIVLYCDIVFTYRLVSYTLSSPTLYYAEIGIITQQLDQVRMNHKNINWCVGGRENGWGYWGTELGSSV